MADRDGAIQESTIEDFEVTPVLDRDLVIKERVFAEYSQELKNYLDFISRNKKSPSIRYIAKYYLYKLVEKWQPILGFAEQTIQADLLDIQTPKLDTKTSLSIKDVLKQEDSESSWLVPSLLQSCGMYILGGEPKTGKSLLCYALCYAMCVSGEFLGLPVKKGNVLFLQLEEPLPTVKKRFKKAGFGNIGTDAETSLMVNFQDNRLRIERNFDVTTDINWLIEYIAKYEIDLVIIDSLRKATAKSTYSENTNEFGKLVYGLQQVFTVTNTCGLVVHHLSKVGGDNKRKHNLIDRLAGHTSISAASDGLIGLFDATANGQPMLQLKTKPRDGFAVSITYSQTTTIEGLWEFKAVSTDSPAKWVSTSQTLRCLSQSPDTYLTVKDIADKIGTSTNNADFLEGLQYLADLEIVSTKYSNRRCYHMLSSNNTWMVNPVSIKSLVSGAVLDANNLMLCTTKPAIRALSLEWSAGRKKDALSVLLPEERDRIESLILSREFKIGDTVHIPPAHEMYYVRELLESKPSLSNNLYKIEADDGSCYEVQEHQLVLNEEIDYDSDVSEDEGIDIPDVMEF